MAVASAVAILEKGGCAKERYLTNQELTPEFSPAFIEFGLTIFSWSRRFCQLLKPYFRATTYWASASLSWKEPAKGSRDYHRPTAIASRRCTPWRSIRASFSIAWRFIRSGKGRHISVQSFPRYVAASNLPAEGARLICLLHCGDIKGQVHHKKRQSMPARCLRVSSSSTGCPRRVSSREKRTAIFSGRPL